MKSWAWEARRRRHDLLKPGAGPAIADIFGDRAAEEHRLLQHDADLPAQILQANPAQVHCVDLDGPAVHVVEPADQVHRGGLAHPGFAHQADHFPTLYVKVDALQDGFAPVVAKGNLAEPHSPFHLRHGNGARVRVGLGRGVDDLEDPLGARERPGHPGIDHSKPLQGTIDHPHVGVECQQRSQCKLTGKDFPATEEPDDQDAQAGQKGHG